MNVKMWKCGNVANSQCQLPIGKWSLAMAALAILATLVCGCYVGKAEFRGEDMKMYPFFGTTVGPAPQPQPCGEDAAGCGNT